VVSPNGDLRGLRYVGNGAALVNIPARDLTAAEIRTLEARYAQQGAGFEGWAAGLALMLVASGLYEPLTENDDARTEKTT
jgi:hypothetical protein